MTPSDPDKNEDAGTEATPPPVGRVQRWFDARFRTAAAVYGLVIFTALIVSEAEHAESAGEVLVDASSTLLVFFIAHVFAHTLTYHGSQSLPQAIKHALVHASGMLWASLPAAITLILAELDGTGVFGATVAAVLVAIVMLAILGFVAYSRRGSHPVIRLFGALGTVILGLIVVLLEWSTH